MMSPLRDLVALDDPRALVDARVLVGAAELGEAVDLRLPAVLYWTVIESPLTSRISPSSIGLDQVGRVAGGAGLDAGADVRRLGADQRHGLVLHVGAHRAPGWRRRARGTGSAPCRPRRSASARRPCSRPRPAARSRCRWWHRRSSRASSILRRSSRLAACGERRTRTRSSLNVPSALIGVLAWATT